MASDSLHQCVDLSDFTGLSTLDADLDSDNFAACVCNRFWLTTLTVDQAKVHFRPRLGNNFDIVSCLIGDEQPTRVDILSSPNKLGHIYEFSRLVLQRSTKSLVVCITPGKRGITTAALLLGGYLLVCENMGLEQINQEFRLLNSSFLTFSDSDGGAAVELTVMDCLAALHKAKSHGWLDFSDQPSDDSIDMEEHLHYDSAANGRLHVVVPNKLLAFACPTDLPDGQAWADHDGVRTFSPSYYAEILGDFDVSVAVCCCGADAGSVPYDAAALGVAVEALCADARSGRLLGAVDRLLTLARAAPGALALHGGGGWEEGLLLSACLIRLFGFTARAAVAWARMAHPPAPVAAPHLAFHATVDEEAEEPAGPVGSQYVEV